MPKRVGMGTAGRDRGNEINDKSYVDAVRSPHCELAKVPHEVISTPGHNNNAQSETRSQVHDKNQPEEKGRKDISAQMASN